ncbi:hypothetical protein K458DRAFT_393020 [Lentithecium fluviatile CBS 122367]|uniref:Uncharacterized protein n=1 Tax=Lentithecium fluviatile CBS 122367 TaxID=1168545 RepID=A0A6G1IQ50_9PLEO|nr:hypothetical protein K458DRAFT_393020 [Lentithecium fluviatile CBS 122367]
MAPLLTLLDPLTLLPLPLLAQQPTTVLLVDIAAVYCTKESAPTDCGLTAPMTIAGGPSTAEITDYSQDAMHWSRCQCSNSRPMVCVIGGTSSGVTEEPHTNSYRTGLDVVAVTLTVGLDKLSASGM